jgi:hypothetical protein
MGTTQNNGARCSSNVIFANLAHYVIRIVAIDIPVDRIVPNNSIGFRENIGKGIVVISTPVMMVTDKN